MPKTSSNAHALPFPLPPPEGRPRFLPVVTVCCCSPLPSAALSRSSSWRRMSSRASLRRVRSMTSSVLIAVRPAWREKVSRSRDVLAVKCQADVSPRYGVAARGARPAAGVRFWRWIRIPICVYTSSVKAPINCGVAFRSSARRASSTNWPIEYQSADLRRCGGLGQPSFNAFAGIVLPPPFRRPRRQRKPCCSAVVDSRALKQAEPDATRPEQPIAEESGVLNQRELTSCDCRERNRYGCAAPILRVRMSPC